MGQYSDVEACFLSLIPDDPTCWMDPTWGIPREIRKLRITGFLEVLTNRARFHVSLDYTTRVAQVIGGSQNGRVVGFLPLFTQIHENPEDVVGDNVLDISFKRGKKSVIVPSGFIKEWFQADGVDSVSLISGLKLPSVLAHSLVKTDRNIDLLPFLEHIFGASLSPLVMRRVPEFINRLMKIKTSAVPPSVEVILIKI